MKIMYIIDQYKPECYSGAIKFAENIINHFSKENEVILISYSQNTNSNMKNFSQIQYWKEYVDGISCIKFILNNSNYINYELYNDEIYKFALELIKENGPDIIHFCHPRRVASFIKAAIDLKQKYIITSTDSFLVCPNLFLFTKDSEICYARHRHEICSEKCHYSSKIIAHNKKIVSQYVSNAFALITPSQFQGKIYEEYFDIKCVTVNHGNVSSNKKLKPNRYPKDKLQFCFTANSEAHKGLIVAIAAFNSLPKEINAELYVYGYCDDSIRISSGSKVIFKGRYSNSNVSEILNNADAVICPSIWYENYPFTITEAFANGVPVIATNEGGMKELVKNCINGFTFEIGDYNHLAQIIKFLYFNQNIFEQLRKNIYQQNIKSIEDEMKEYNNIYHRCLNNNEINIERKSALSYIWEKILTDKYGNINFKKYERVINDVSHKHDFYINDDKKYRFILRLNNMESVLKDKSQKTLIVWGTGTSARITIEVLRKLYENINIKFVVDKFKEDGIFEGIPVKNIQSLKYYYFDYVFICTSPGKKDAEEIMKKSNKTININYNFGICVE